MLPIDASRQARGKLRGTDEAKSKMTWFDEKIDDLDKEPQRLRAMRRSLGPSKKAELMAT
jgi:hypothetical protein